MSENSMGTLAQHVAAIGRAFVVEERRMEAKFTKLHRRTQEAESRAAKAARCEKGLRRRLKGQHDRIVAMEAELEELRPSARAYDAAKERLRRVRVAMVDVRLMDDAADVRRALRNALDWAPSTVTSVPPPEPGGPELAQVPEDQGRGAGSEGGPVPGDDELLEEAIAEAEGGPERVLVSNLLDHRGEFAAHYNRSPLDDPKVFRETVDAMVRRGPLPMAPHAPLRWGRRPDIEGSPPAWIVAGSNWSIEVCTRSVHAGHQLVVHNETTRVETYLDPEELLEQMRVQLESFGVGWASRETIGADLVRTLFVPCAVKPEERRRG